ncbi:ABC transporter B family member 11 [Ananas comosus]|uniref:ABC transporter B family member 11 n=1 Tax=Ananas comosus TaxID=4615 RepID=A0A199VP97_ANACO|nr:ABC transporter B family member 11 [Ananas comosus]
MVTGERQAARIRGLYLKAILRQDIAFFDKEMTTGQAVTRMSGDTILIQDAIGEKVGKFIQLVATFLGGFIIAFTKGWLLSLVMLSSIPPLVIACTTMSWFVSKMTSRRQATYSNAGNVVEQTIGSIRTVASFNGEKKAIALYNKFIRPAYLSAVQEGTAAGLGMGTVFMVLFWSYALAIWYGSRLIINKGYTGGTVVNVLFAVMTGAMSLGQATPCVTAFAEGQAAAYRMFETIRRKPEIDAYNTSGVVLEDMKGDVELQDVYFSYPTRPDYPIFNGFSLKVSSGTTMAIVGESGSGKSTVINLVERFYDPQAGEVLIDGVNIKSLRLSWIREKIGLVSQEPLLFMTTIKENITYSKKKATLEEIKRATELANATNFIDKLPNGLDTMVGERGAQLSGGQKQRIAIARAILKDPKILLLDEATSALDVESERIVQEALNRVMLKRTTIVVAHRLSTVRNAGTISVVHQGKIVEQGCHDELIKNPDGAYSQLIHLQETHKETKEHVGDSAMRSLSNESKSLSKSKRSISFERSASRGSSIGSSSRHSFTIPFGLTGPMEVQAGPQDETEDKEVVGDVGAPKEVPITRLISLNKPEIPVLLLGSIAAAIHGVLFPVFGILLSISIKIFFEEPHQLQKDSNFWTSMYVVLGITALFVIPIENFLFGVAGGRLVERIRSMSFQRIIHQEINWFDDPRNSSGAIGARLSIDATNVRRLLGDTLALMVQCLSTLLTGFIVAMVASWRLALIITVVIPLVGFQGYAQIKFMKGYSADAKMMYEEASQVANDAVSGIRTVASFSAEQRVMETYKKKCEAPVKQGVRQGLISGFGYGFSFFTLYLTPVWLGFCNSFCIPESCKQAFTILTLLLPLYVTALPNSTSIEALATTVVLQVFFALVLATIGISQTSALGADSTKAKESTASIFGIIDRKSKTVALVGESGSGKSTVISLLERFYDPDSGKILFDGVEIETLRVSWLRQQMGLVSQEPVLFNDTIRTNIAYGKEGEASEEEIVKVAKTANAHQFISGLPQGYDTPVGERGIQLSGGQKQRIAIARAILKDPTVLLLDEATSALDAESEHVVQEALDRVMVGRTTVVVAHRLSTIKGADMIVVLKNGMIVEKGRHETLMGLKEGVYASLVELRISSE